LVICGGARRIRSRRGRGVRRAVEFGPDPIQPPLPMSPLRTRPMSEDCLTLNIWTPASRDREKLPVMLWIPGGSFVAYSGADPMCDGENFARKGVVVVTINYRVGLFGFLAHAALSAESERGASGNYGLMDQIAALRWVRDNIAAFVGDPNRVTAMGVSAGGASISLLMISPLGEGVFQQTILESPGSLRPLANLEEAETAGPDARKQFDGDARDVRGRGARENQPVRAQGARADYGHPLLNLGSGRRHSCDKPRFLYRRRNLSQLGRSAASVLKHAAHHIRVAPRNQFPESCC